MIVSEPKKVKTCERREKNSEEEVTTAYKELRYSAEEVEEANKQLLNINETHQRISEIISKRENS